MPYRKIGAHHVTDLLTQKNTEGVNFQSKNNVRPPVMYTANTPPSRDLAVITPEIAEIVKGHNEM